jgi:glycosyltransferase involved in cell wall biosynthesis
MAAPSASNVPSPRRLPVVTLLTPVFNEEGNLDDYRAAVESTLFSREDVRVEVLFIDDGSRDGSWAILKKFCCESDRFHAIRLSRNFGPHAALAAGLESVGDTDAIAILACDLQDPPSVVGEFIDRWKGGAQIVFGHRRVRHDSAFRNVSGRIFHTLLQRTAMPRHSRFATGSFLLADRKVVECYRTFREHNRITFAMIAWTGFAQEAVEYERVARRRGKSGWSFGRLFKAFYDVFIGYSHLPIRLISIVGFATFIGSVLLAVYAVIIGLRGGSVPGWASTLAVTGIFFGIQFFLMSIVGEYLYRMYLEVVQRPLYFISDTASRNDP